MEVTIIQGAVPLDAVPMRMYDAQARECADVYDGDDLQVSCI